MSAMMTTDQLLRIVYLVMMLALIGGMSGLVRRQPRKTLMRDLLIWFAIVVFLVMAYNLMNYIRTAL
jgi:hypothetical protein